MHISQKEALLLPFVSNLTNPYVWELLDILAVVFELSFFFSVFKKRLFQIYLCIGVTFHFLNLLVLNIPFQNMMMVYLLYSNWEPLTRAVKKKIYIHRYINLKNMILMAVCYLIFYIVMLVSHPGELFSLSPFELLLSIVSDRPKFIEAHLVLSVALIFVIINVYKFFSLRLRLYNSSSQRNRAIEL